MLQNIKQFIRDEEGATAIEYALIVGLIAVVVAVVLITLGGSLTTLFSKVSTCVSSPSAGNC
ncbi:MAG: Flp family type IVb pilin [Stenotrophobium sp.]